jgi:hypothetical protein
MQFTACTSFSIATSTEGMPILAEVFTDRGCNDLAGGYQAVESR